MNSDEFMILAHESALKEMQLRSLRLARQIRRDQHDLCKLLQDIETKQSQVNYARELYLQGAM